MNIFQYVLAVAYIIIGASFVVKYPIPKLPEKWLVYVLILALVLVVAFIFLGTLTPVLA
jgi:glucan phosphoethanolaminetransferase (alkaline phosphatase superfamily)